MLSQFDPVLAAVDEGHHEGEILPELPSDEEDFLDRCVDRLLDNDPELRNFHLLEPDAQARERFFLTNSTRGYMGFFKENH